MWNISHPEMVSNEEYEDYNIVFVASEVYDRKLDSLLSTKVVPLLQCTDPGLFYPDANPAFASDLLFVGNSRNTYRKILKDLLPAEYDLKVWGTRWEQFIDQKYIQGEYFPNERLRQLYSSCKILLNDHWDDMREKGFISNRIFDALACKTFIISDEVAGLQDVLGDAVVTYRDALDLKEKIAYYLKHEAARREIAEKGYALVAENHTFNNRVCKIIEYMGTFLGRGSTGKDVKRGLEKIVKKKDGEIQYWKERYIQKEAELNMTINNFQQSLSWKITGPLRTMHRLLGRNREKH
jgi:spore maturation protein CgeB